MDNKRQRSSSWVEDVQRAADGMAIASASLRLLMDRDSGAGSEEKRVMRRKRADTVQDESPLSRIAKGRDLLQGNVRERPVSMGLPPSSSSTRDSAARGSENPFRSHAGSSPSGSSVTADSSPRRARRSELSTRSRTPPPPPMKPIITRPAQGRIQINQRTSSHRSRHSSQNQYPEVELEHLRPAPPPHAHLPNTTIVADNSSDCYYYNESTHLALQPTLLQHNDSTSTIIPDPADSSTSLLSYYFPHSSQSPSPLPKPIPARKPVPISKSPHSSSASKSSSPPPPLPSSSPPTSTTVTRPPSLTSPLHEILFVLLICLAQVLMLAGLAQAMVPSSIISRSFISSDPRGTAVPWYSAAYGLTSATFVLPSGRVGDLFGHRKVFVAGWVWFGIWSLASGLSVYAEGSGNGNGNGNGNGGKGAGIGPALLVPSGQALLGRTYPPSVRKNMVLCLFGASAPLGFVSGAIFSSLFAVRGPNSWPWAFYVLSIFCFLLGILSLFVLPPTGPSGYKPAERLWTQLDACGMLLGVSGLVLLNFAFNQAPIVSWKTPYTYFLLIIGLLLLAAFVWHEWKSAVYPLIPIKAMKPATNFVLGCTGAGWGCFSIWVYYCCRFEEMMRGWGPVLTSVGFIPAPICGLAASILAGFLISKIKPHWIMLISMCAFFVGSLLLATAPVSQSYWLNTFFGILIMPFGMDMSNPAATILLSNSVSKEHQGIAASLVVTTVNYSISIALGIAGTIEVHTNDGGYDILKGYRAAQYFGTGLGFLGVLLALCFLLQSYYQKAPPPPPQRGSYIRAHD
ncbi:putative drug resistance protein [Cladorrhinum sp. PSN332]|nr:putative drug resistance protein [Cladorrhinum sp. PSN332]